MADQDKQAPSLIAGNMSAVRTVMAAVQSTIGPKGLDTMLLDPFGEVTITNDGYTILSMMDSNHPVTKLLIHAVKAQEEEMGDGTTTTALLACALVLGGYQAVEKGLPVTHVIEGLNAARMEAEKRYKEIALAQHSKEAYKQIAMIAARENKDIADLVIQAAESIGYDHLKEENVNLAEMVQGVVGADNEVVDGLVFEKEPQLATCPEAVEGAYILALDDALEIDRHAKELANTEAGFQHYLRLQEDFYRLIKRMIDSPINAVFVQRGIDSKAEALLSQAGIFTLSRVRLKDMDRLSRYTGAKLVKMSQLMEEETDFASLCGQAEKVLWHKNHETTAILGGQGEPMATAIVGAATKEVLGERTRIACDAASSLQAAVCGGLVAGGGASELSVARHLNRVATEEMGLQSVGYSIMADALQKPFRQMVENAGFQSMEKQALVNAAQEAQDSSTMGLNLSSGEVADLLTIGVLDPLEVKLSALKIATEVAQSILKINIIVRKKAYKPEQGSEVT